MNNEIPDKKGLDTLIKEVPPSSIPLDKIIPEQLKPKPDINSLNREIWGNKSNQLLDDYKYGEALARFGESNMTAKAFFKRLAMSISAIISNEHQKRGLDSLELRHHYQILDATLQLIAKEIDKKDLKDFDISSIISAMQGFITNYNQPKETK